MKTIKNLKFTHSKIEIEFLNSSLKLECFKQKDGLFIDISQMNLIQALKTAVNVSTYCFVKEVKHKICWLVKDNEIKKQLSVLALQNMNSIVYEKEQERAFA